LIHSCKNCHFGWLYGKPEVHFAGGPSPRPVTNANCQTQKADLSRENKDGGFGMSSVFFNVNHCMQNLSKKRPIFHSEADFQFALAREIQTCYPDADIRLEYCPIAIPNTHIDIIVFHNGKVIPIELKYKTAKFACDYDKEFYHLKNHGAQDLGKYDCLKDIKRLEELSLLLDNFSHGYAIWLTNDASYWAPPVRANTAYENFSIHHTAQKHGSLAWASHAGIGTTKGREKPIVLKDTYDILWKSFSNLGGKKGALFNYAVLTVNK